MILLGTYCTANASVLVRLTLGPTLAVLFPFLEQVFIVPAFGKSLAWTFPSERDATQSERPGYGDDVLWTQ